jgi:ribosomal protein S18 acetylase RimI-like enzyme
MGSSSTTVVVRVTEGVHWHALEDDVVVGRGHALRRPDGRVLISVDSWRDDVFETLAVAMIDDLGRGVRTAVDDDDREVLARWSALGFRDDRRDVEYLVPTDPAVTGLPDDLPAGTTLLPGRAADPDRLAALDHELLQGIAATLPWAAWPAEPVTSTPGVVRPVPVTRWVAVRDGEYVGSIRVSAVRRRARLALVAVLPEHRRRGVARGLIAAEFRRLHEDGVSHVTAEVDETATAARALLRGVGGQETGRVVEMALGPEARHLCTRSGAAG